MPAPAVRYLPPSLCVPGQMRTVCGLRLQFGKAVFESRQHVPSDRSSTRPGTVPVTRSRYVQHVQERPGAIIGVFGLFRREVRKRALWTGGHVCHHHGLCANQLCKQIEEFSFPFLSGFYYHPFVSRTAAGTGRTYGPPLLLCKSNNFGSGKQLFPGWCHGERGEANQILLW